MVKGRNFLFIGAGVAALYYLGAKAYNIKEAVKRLSVTNPKIAARPSIKALNIFIDISVDIVNPGSSDIPFEYYAGTIIYDSTKIADFNFNGNGKSIILKARSKTPLAFQVSVTNINTFYKITKIIIAVNKNLPVDTKIAINSSIYAAGLDVPVNFIYDIKKLEVVSGIGKVNFMRRAKQVVQQRATHRCRHGLQPVPLVVPAPVYNEDIPLQNPTINTSEKVSGIGSLTNLPAFGSKEEEILFITKQINSLKIKRNNALVGSSKAIALQQLINTAEEMLQQKRIKYGI